MGSSGHVAAGATAPLVARPAPDLAEYSARVAENVGEAMALTEALMAGETATAAGSTRADLRSLMQRVHDLVTGGPEAGLGSEAPSARLLGTSDPPSAAASVLGASPGGRSSAGYSYGRDPHSTLSTPTQGGTYNWGRKG